MPDQQGQLDSLCGVYVIINAVNLVYPMRRQDRVLLFKQLLTTLKRDEYLTIAIMSGTYKRHMNLMLKTAKQLIYRQHKVTIKVEPLFRVNKGVYAKQFYKKLGEFLEQKNRAVIINLSGALNHWSCIKEVTKTSLLLEDSYGYRYVRKSSIHIGLEYVARHIIAPTDCWALSLSE